MSTQPSSLTAADPQQAPTPAERDIVLVVGWRVDQDYPGLRAVPYLVRGHPQGVAPGVRYVVLLAPVWCRGAEA